MAYPFHPVANIFPLIEGDEFKRLVEDIKQHGLIVPIMLHEGQIIDGRNRYRACEAAGIEPKFETWRGEGDLVKFTVSLNLHRRHLDESQRSMVGARVANMRQGERTDLTPIGGTSQDAAAELVNVGVRTIQRAAVVLAEATPSLIACVDAGLLPVSRAAQLVDTEPSFQRAVVQKVNDGMKPTEAIRQTKKELLPEVELPTGKYRVLYADPPWKYGDERIGGDTKFSTQYPAAATHYPTMTIAELCAKKVKDIAEDNAVLFLWVTSPLLFESHAVIEAWGFQYKASFVWDKVKHNVGHYNSVRHEFLLICTRGSCLPDVPTLLDSVVEVDRSEVHSQKPERFREIIDELYPQGKRIELFVRGPLPANWEGYGNEYPK